MALTLPSAWSALYATGGSVLRRCDSLRKVGRHLQGGKRASRNPRRLNIPIAGVLLALAYPDRIAKARGKTGEFLMANGRLRLSSRMNVWRAKPISR